MILSCIEIASRILLKGKLDLCSKVVSRTVRLVSVVVMLDIP